MSLSAEQRRELLALARRSIEAGLQEGRRVAFPDSPVHAANATRGSSFVTLHTERELRGCCGTLQAERELAEDVWHNAWSSAFSDPRFVPLTATEYPRIDVHIAVLSAPEPMEVHSEPDLLRSVRPGIDGLVLAMGSARATFLPAVWDQLPRPVDFVRQLKLKAGWSPDFWSPQVRVLRYTTEDFGEKPR